MNHIAKIFSKDPSATDIRISIKEVEREQQKRRRDLENLSRTKQEKVNDAVAAKKAGKQELLREIFRELRQIEIDNNFVSSDLRRLSLSKTALTAFLKKVDLLEKNRDHRSTQNLILRFKNSPIEKMIDTADVDDDTFNSMLGEILGEEEVPVNKKEPEDAGFAEFDRAISGMARGENVEPLTGPSIKDADEEARKMAEEARKLAEEAQKELDKLRYPSNFPDLKRE